MERGEVSGGMQLVSWERVCTPKEKGAAGLHSLQSINKVLLCKWL